MQPNKPPRHSHYLFKAEDYFKLDDDLAHAFLKRNYSPGMHMQDFFEINIVVSGSGVHYIGDDMYIANVGDCFVIPPNTPHGYLAPIGFNVYHFVFKDEFLKKYFSDFRFIDSFEVIFGSLILSRDNAQIDTAGKDKNESKSRIKSTYVNISPKYLKTMVDILDEMVLYKREDVKVCTVKHFIMNSLAASVIAMICDAYNRSSDIPIYKKSSEYEAMTEVFTLLHKRYNESFALEELARVAHLSRSTFLRRFKSITGGTPAEYVTDLRVSAAKSMLVDTAISISDIAITVGFYDSPHFSRVFKSKTGVSPMAYRNKNN